MTPAIAGVFQKHHAFYEVSPYYVVIEEREGHSDPRKILAGYDVDIYECDPGKIPAESTDYAIAYDALQAVAREVSAAAQDCCTVEVIPSEWSVVLDTRNHFERESRLRIRICHWRGLDQPAGVAEERALKAVRQKLEALGVGIQSKR